VDSSDLDPQHTLISAAPCSLHSLETRPVMLMSSGSLFLITFLLCCCGDHDGSGNAIPDSSSASRASSAPSRDGDEAPGTVASSASGDVLPAGGTTDLRWKWSPGETRKYRVLQGYSVIVDDITTTDKVGYEWRLNLKEINANGNYVIDALIEAVSIEQTQSLLQMGAVEYNSKDPKKNQPTHPITTAYAGLLGRGFTFSMEPTGRVVEVRGMQKVAERFVQSMGASALFEGKYYQHALGDESIKQELSRLFSAVPGKSVAQRETWIHPSSKYFPMMGVVDFSTSFTLSQLKVSGGKKIADLLLSSQMTITQPLEQLHPQPSPLGIGDIEYSKKEENGEEEFLVDEGALKFRKSKMEISATVRRSGQSLALNYVQQTIVELAED